MDRVNRSPERQFDGSELDWLIEQYLAESKSRVSKNTLRDYTYLLDYFARWWHTVGYSQGFVFKRTDFQEYVRWLEVQPSHQGGNIGYGTIESALRRLRQVFRWGYKEGFLSRDYGTWIPKPKGKPLPKGAPDPSCLQQLFDGANQTDKPIRNKAILAVLIGTAVRRAECVSIDIEDVRFLASGGGQILIKKGKGSKPRIVVFDEIAGRFLSTHLLFMAESGFSSGPLFLGKSKTRMLAKSLNGVIDNIVKHAGLTGVIRGPHDLRRMFATYWSRQHRGEGYTQPLSMQLGHNDPKMTIHYSKQTIDDVEQVFVSPLEVLKKPS